VDDKRAVERPVLDLGAEPVGREHRQGDAGFHVDAPAPVEPSVPDDAVVRSVGPLVGITGGNHVEMTVQDEDR
jgi:hypothetical protein